MHYKCHKISLNLGRSCIIKATINPRNNDDKCFQNAVTVASNYEKYRKDPQRIAKTKPIIKQYKWKEMKFSCRNKRLEKAWNKSIAVNVLFSPSNREEIKQVYISKDNSDVEIK